MSHQRRHSLPLNNVESEETDLYEVLDMRPNPIPAKNRKISHNSQRYVSLSAIPEEMLTIDTKDTLNERIIINDPSPDGGYGWVIVLASFLCNLTVDGICYTFGIFFNDFVAYFHSSKAITALAGSLLSGCYLTSGVFVSGLTNRYGCRPITIIGSIISSMAFLVATVAPNSFVLLITYGITAGIGFGLIYLPAIVTVGYYFTTKRAFATGIAVCGSGMGAFLFAPLCQWLLSIYDWKNALIILSGLILNCAVFGALMRPLNVVITEEVEETLISNTEPGVHSDLNIHRSVIKNADENHLTKSELIINRSRSKYRSVSDSRAPKLEDILKLDHNYRSSSTTIVIPPMAKKDVFYSGSTLNLKFDSFENLGSVSSRISSQKHLNNNNVNNKRLNKVSVTSGSPDFFLNEIPVKSNGRISDSNDNKDNACGVVRDIFDLSVLKKPPMALLSISNIFGMTGYYIPFVYITQHVRKSIKDGDEYVSAEKAALLLSAIGIANVCGRLLFGWLSDKISGKRLNAKIRITALTINNVCLLMSGLTTMAIPIWSQYYLLLIDCILFGLFISSYMSLTSIILVDLLGIETLSTTFGLISCFRGISSIVGPPLAGALYDITGSFDIVFISAGILLIISSIISFFVAKYEK